jgi:hypothetical protein
MQSITGGDDFISGISEPNPDTHALIKLQGNNYSTQTDLYFNPLATEGYDRIYDAGKFANRTSDFDLYTKIADQSVDDINFVIQTISNNITQNAVIPLGVHVPAGTGYSIALDEDTFLDQINIYLKDYQTGALTLLNQGSYTFSSESDLQGNSRFELIINSVTLGLDSQQLTSSFKTIYQNDGVLLVGDFMPKDEVEIFNVMGQLIKVYTLDNNQYSLKIPNHTLAPGVYLAKIKTNNSPVTIKFIIK